MSKILPSVALSLAALVPFSTAARSGPEAGTGSAIALAFDVRHDVVRPGEEVELLACLTNTNLHSGRSVEPGDSFYFDFGLGHVDACVVESAWSPDGSFAASAFECSATPSGLVISRMGDIQPWPHGAVVCSRASFTAGPASASVTPRLAVANRGAYAPPDPGALLLTVGDGVGSVGPAGPPGPIGPVGPVGATGPTGATGLTGASGVGGRWEVRSTGAVVATRTDPWRPIPGLELDVETAAGSRLIVIVSVVMHVYCAAVHDDFWRDGRLHLEIDGEVVGSRAAPPLRHSEGLDRLGHLDATIPLLSDPVGPGNHEIRVLLEGLDHPSLVSTTFCAGDDEVGGDREARLLVLELPAEP